MVNETVDENVNNFSGIQNKKTSDGTRYKKVSDFARDFAGDWVANKKQRTEGPGERERERQRERAFEEGASSQGGTSNQ